MVKLLLISFILLSPACSALRHIRPQVDVQAQKAEKDANILKTEGEVKAEANIDTEIKAQIGAVNKALKQLLEYQVQAGRDSVFNDTGLLIVFLETLRKIAIAISAGAVIVIVGLSYIGKRATVKIIEKATDKKQ